MKSRWAMGLVSVWTAALLCGCTVEQEPVKARIFAMDTVMSLTAYGAEGTKTAQEETQQAVDQAVALIYQLENQLSVTREGSEIYAVNHAGGEETSISGETEDLLSRGLALCEQTGGALDITAYPAVAAWGFTTGEYRVPDPDERSALAALIDYSAVELGDGNVRLPEGMELDLGAVAKGFLGDQLADFLKESGVESGILDLGGNVQAIGGKPDGSPWRIGIQDPASDQGDYLAAVEIRDEAVVTSGGYQRFFEENGQIYWHIMDTKTAAPARSGLSSVTVVGPEGFLCDGLSTALFVMGLEDAGTFWQDNPDLGVELILITETGEIAITAGLEDRFSLVDGYQGREVTVIGP